MPLFNPPTIVQGGGGNDSGIYTDAEGWLIVPGQLPSKIVKEALPDGGTRYLRLVLDGAVERETGMYDYPA